MMLSNAKQVILQSALRTYDNKAQTYCGFIHHEKALEKSRIW